MSVKLTFNKETRWTKALKHMLADLKLCLRWMTEVQSALVHLVSLLNVNFTDMPPTLSASMGYGMSNGVSCSQSCCQHERG